MNDSNGDHSTTVTTLNEICQTSSPQIKTNSTFSARVDERDDGNNTNYTLSHLCLTQQTWQINQTNPSRLSKIGEFRSIFVYFAWQTKTFATSATESQKIESMWTHLFVYVKRKTASGLNNPSFWHHYIRMMRKRKRKRMMA